MYAIFDKVNFGNFDKESQILAIHTGGLRYSRNESETPQIENAAVVMRIKNF